ncbi:hypothetical protein RND71_025053 [Anisodus tanguticus]|uniref:Uncharacterized protein n=1 Tax=Anisodus tanguticus TaxID=243964 RepID=A0AAE1RRJ4_9SOLA|nr:hypothetical protein RND71_025053 [Anisodus tanguticus]
MPFTVLCSLFLGKALNEPCPFSIRVPLCMSGGPCSTLSSWLIFTYISISRSVTSFKKTQENSGRVGSNTWDMVWERTDIHQYDDLVRKGKGYKENFAMFKVVLPIVRGYAMNVEEYVRIDIEKRIVSGLPFRGVKVMLKTARRMEFGKGSLESNQRKKAYVGQEELLGIYIKKVIQVSSRKDVCEP